MDKFVPPSALTHRFANLQLAPPSSKHPRTTHPQDLDPTRGINVSTRSYHEPWVKCRLNLPHDGFFVFPRRARHVIRNLRNSKDDAAKALDTKIEAICHATGAYILLPSPSSYAARIWGTSSQVEAARFQLDALVDNMESTMSSWEKIRGVDARMEDRALENCQKEALMNKILVHAEGVDYRFGFYLLLPPGFDLYEFIDAHDQTIIDEFRKTYCPCLVKYDRAARLVMTFATTEETVLALSQPVRYLVDSFASRSFRKVRKNLVRIFARTLYPSTFRLKAQPTAKVALALPQGEYYPPANTIVNDQRWHCQLRVTGELAEILQKSLGELKLPRTQVQMRASFGHFGLERYLHPANGKDVFLFGDFCETIRSSDTILRLLGLHSMPPEYSHNLNVVLQNQGFLEPVTTHAVYFDFHPAQLECAVMRLVCEYACFDTEVEITDMKWIEHETRADSNVVEVNVYSLDVAQPSWQFQIGASVVYDNKIIPPSLRKFQNSIRITTDPLTTSATGPRPHVAFMHPETDQLCQVSEVTIWTYHSTRNNGVFELRQTHTRGRPLDHTMGGKMQGKTEDETRSRMVAKKRDEQEEKIGDEMMEMEESTVGNKNSSDKTTWSAAYYYSDWPILLAEFARPGSANDVSWERSIDTFFPDPHDGRSFGMSGFVRDVEELQRILASVHA